MEFKPIETQEQFNAMVADRIARAEETAARRAKEEAAKEYGDYEDLKTKNTDYEKQIADLTKELKGRDDKMASSDDEITKLKEKVQEYETASVKTRIAHEEGLPYELAGKLSGDDEDAIRADAKSMAKFIQKEPEAPLGSGEPVDTGDPTKAAYSSMLKELEKE